MRIQVLPQNLINQIAAGEVIVNMASAVKEMVENSIDARATHIDVELANGMHDVIVSDDGSGMDRDDAELSLQRHATSKIRTAEDLFRVQTRGFRGEALPSIASVSRMEIQTRPADQLSGTRIVVEGGKILTIEGTGCPNGTRIIIRDLFYNTPARRKFLKSPTSEFNAVMRIVIRQALAAHTIGLRVIKEGDTLLELPVGQSLADRFTTIAGSRIQHGILKMAFERQGVAVEGFIAQPLSNRGDRGSEFLFVNGRPFVSKAIASAAEQACRGFLMTRRFPIFCLFITVPPEEVDINVHPTKDEVRFRDERNIAGACFHAVRNALEAHGHVPDMRLDQERSPEESPRTAEQQSMPGFFTSPQELVSRAFQKKQARAAQTDWVGIAARNEDRQPSAPEFAPASDPAQSEEAPAHPPEPAFRKDTGQHREHISAGPGEQPDPHFWERPYEPEPLGQVALTYIAARFGEDLLLIDQHAAHERIRFIELQNRPGKTNIQPLLVPEIIEVPPDRVAALGALLPILTDLGFEIEEFGGTTYQVTAVPGDLSEADVPSLIRDLVDEFEESPRKNRLDDLRERVLIRAACHSSVRSGDRLSEEEMRELLAQMRRHQLSFRCPHGRPTIIRLSRDELDRQFKRLH